MSLAPRILRDILDAAKNNPDWIHMTFEDKEFYDLSETEKNN